MINELLPCEIGISVSYPLPGTLFHEKVKAEMKEKTNWTDSDELALMFRNTYAPPFYKQLHRYVHKSYRKHIAIENIKNILKKPASVSSENFKKAASFIYYAPAAFFAKQKLNMLEKSPA
jgi:anaerobic magnesium-protoporphyrin IX monomethyl ester cyclase